MYKIVFVDYNEDRRTTIRMLFNEAKSLQMNTYSYMDKVDFDDNVVLLSWHISNTETRDNDQCEFAKLAEGSAGCYFIQHSGALSASTMNHDTKTGTCSLEDIQSLFKHLAQKDSLVTKESIFQTIEEFFIDEALVDFKVVVKKTTKVLNYLKNDKELVCNVEFEEMRF